LRTGRTLRVLAAERAAWRQIRSFDARVLAASELTIRVKEKPRRLSS